MCPNHAPQPLRSTSRFSLLQRPPPCSHRSPEFLSAQFPTRSFPFHSDAHGWSISLPTNLLYSYYFGDHLYQSGLSRTTGSAHARAREHTHTPQRFIFKDLAHTIMGPGKPKIYWVAQQPGNPGRSCCFSLKAGFLLWETLDFALQALQLIG